MRFDSNEHVLFEILPDFLLIEEQDNGYEIAW